MQKSFFLLEKLCWKHKRESLSNGILMLALLVLLFFLLIKLVLRFSLGWCFENLVHCVRC